MPPRAVLPLLLFGVLLEGQQVNPPMQHESYRSRSDIQSPVAIHRVEPDYTPEARAKGIQGIVILQCEVTEEGVPENVSVIRRLDSGPDANAVEALKQWKFKPAMKEGGPVRFLGTVQMNFRLDQHRK